MKPVINFLRTAAPGSSSNSTSCWFLVTALVCASAGCIQPQTDEVVVLCALDREFAAPVLGEAEVDCDLPMRVKYDIESNKTVGLTNEIIRNGQRQRADLFWNNEILHTIRLQRLGLLASVETTHCARFPKRFMSPTGHWFGFAARGRVLIVNTDLMRVTHQRPNSFADLAEARFAGKCTLARPFFGTSATHAAVMFDRLGPSEAARLYSAIAHNAVLQGGNKQVAEKVAAGQFLFGLTDTDDALVEIDAGKPVVIVFPDQGDQEMGTLLIPNTLSVIKNGPHTPQATRLLQRLLMADVEERLAAGASGQIPLATDVAARSRVTVDGLKVMAADFESAADCWEASASQLKQIFPLGK